MRDLRNFYVRANTCVACHQNLDADITAAGHPELLFELDGQSVAEPKHWRDDASTGGKAWIVGQAVALREMSWALSNNPSVDARAAARWRGLVWVLDKVTARQTQLPTVDAGDRPTGAASFVDMQRRADALARAAASASLGESFARDTLQMLFGLGPEITTRSDPLEVMSGKAERLVPALIRLAVAAGLDSDGSPRVERRPLVEAIQPQGSFDPSRFAKALEAYRNAVTEGPAGR